MLRTAASSARVAVLRGLASWLLVCGLGCGLAACGAGGGPTRSEGTLPAARPGRVLVEATSVEELTVVCERKQAPMLGPVPGTDFHLVRCPPGRGVPAFVEELLLETCVLDAQPDDDLRFPEGDGTTIPAFADEDLSAIAAQPALQRVGAVAAQLRGRMGDGVVVAVIDTGVDANHPWLAGRVLPTGYDFVDHDDDPTDEGNGLDDDGDGLVDEGVGHGTFVASLILAVAPGARILPIRALDSDAVGSASGIARAIEYARVNGASIINFSGGADRDIRVIQQAVDRVRGANVVFVAAAGNGGGAVQFPATRPAALAVASVDLMDRRSGFSAYGFGVALCAPGEDLLGAHPSAPSGVARWSGTSFASALVSGGLALLAPPPPSGPLNPVIQRLLSTTAPVDAENPAIPGQLGAGRLDLDAATR